MSNTLKGALIIGQSGGPTSVINASAYGVIRTALDCPDITAVYGAAHGIKGVLNDKLYDMGQEDAKELELLLNTPSSELGSCRYKIADPDVDDTDYKRILEIFKKYNIRYFFYNGGNDSMDTCAKVSRFMAKSGYECRVMGVPKTIDNDLFGTDHCPGFASAAKYIATSCAEVYKDARVYDTGMVTIIEIMGRHAGWLAGAAALAGVGNADLSLPAAEARLKALQERQMELLQMAAGDADNTEFDEEISRVSAAILGLLARKTELEQEGRTDPEYDRRVASITGALEEVDSAAVPFDDVIVRQVISSIRVLDRERLSIRFKDGTEVEQAVEYPQRRVSA